ncbi:MAG: hypothetical protein AB3N23_06520 [Paracoccaceae bacterium]
MQIVPSTIVALIAIAILFRQGPRQGFWAFLALTPMGAAAAFNLPAVGGASILLMQLGVMVVFAMVCLVHGGLDRLAGSMRPGQTGFWVALVLVYCVFSALFAARVFQGQTEVFSLARSVNKTGIVSVPLRATTGNITQLFALVLAIFSFFAFATLFRVNPDRHAAMKAMAAVTIVHVGLGWLDVLSHAVGAPQFLDFLQTANYAILDTHRMIGIKRMVGGFSESSAFGAFSVGLFAFWLVLWLSGPTQPWQRLLLVLSLIAVLRSTSSGGYVSLVIFLLLTGGWLLARNLRDTMDRRVLLVCLMLVIGMWICALAIFGAYHFSSGFSAFIDRSLLTKLESSSGIERMSWNAQAFKNFVDTGLMGAGLGSVRASNWLIATLGSLGLPGTFLCLGVIVSVWRTGRTVQDPMMRALITSLKAACLGLFLNDLLSAPSPVPSVFMLTLVGTIVGLARGYELQNAVPDPRRALRTSLRTLPVAAE